MDEIIKAVGALAWVVGLILVFLVPPIGVVVLILALLLSIRSVSRTRERRHQEILDAARKRE